jgi:hypothetical protein
MFLDANEELEKIEPDVRHVPEVLALRLCIYQKLEKWDLMQAVAKKLARYDPADAQWTINLAYATRRSSSVVNAKAILEDFLKLNGLELSVQYTLACYECRLGHVAKAKEYLNEIFTVEPELRMRALEDEDLEPLWELIGED